MAIKGKWKLNEAGTANRVDSSGIGNTLTAVNSIAQAVGHGGGANLANNFTGTQYLTITDAAQVGLDFSTAFTISVFFKLNATGINHTLVNKWATDELSYNLVVNTSNKLVGYIVNTGIVSITGATSLSAATQYHAFLIYESGGSGLTIYLNNVSDGNVGVSGTLWSGLAPFRIGANGDAVSKANAIIDDVAVFDHAFTAQERADWYAYGDDFASAAVLEGAATEQDTATGSLSMPINLAGAATEQDTATGSLTTGIGLGGSATEQDTSTGTLTGGLSGAAAEQDTATGALTTDISLGGAATEQDTATGNLSVGEISEDIDWRLQDSVGALITGGEANTSLRIGRRSDGYLLDWSDLIFKASGWTTVATTMSEVSATNLPGLYRKVVAIGGWTDGKYFVLLDYSGTPPQHGGEEFSTENGYMVHDYLASRADVATSSRLAAAAYTAPDNAGIAALPTLSEIEASTVLAKQAKLDFVEKWILNKLAESPTGTWKLYDDDGVTVLKTWTWDSGTKIRTKAT